MTHTGRQRVARGDLLAKTGKENEKKREKKQENRRKSRMCTGHRLKRVARGDLSSAVLQKKDVSVVDL